MMYKKTRIAVTGLVAGAAMFAGCNLFGNSDEDTDNSSGTVTQGYVWAEKANYSVIGNIVTLTSVQPGMSVNYCVGNELEQAEVEFLEDNMLVEFQLSGNTLKVSLIDMIGLDTIGSAVVKYWGVGTRKGTGSGLNGVWMLTSGEYEVVSGTLTAEVKADLDQDIAEFNEEIGDEWSLEVKIDDDLLSCYYYELGSPAEKVLWSVDTDYYNVTTEIINSNLAKVTGNKTGEIVTITYNPAEKSYTYISSDPALTHVYYENPETCPNEYRPDWFYTFLSSNWQSGQIKATVQAEKSQLRKLRSMVLPGLKD